MSSRPELRLDWCTHEAAKYACLNWHYSKTVPTGKPSRLGVWEDRKFIGVVFFGSNASAALGAPYRLTNFEVCELVRVAMREHRATCTRILSIAIKMLKKQSPGIRLIVSFADPYQGHHGGIYQGGNWVYTGDSSPSYMWELKNGDLVHERRYSGSGWNAPKQPPKDAVRIRVPGKHRYLMPLDDEIRQRIEPLKKPYPKRVRSEDSGTSGNQPERGGANPTRTLHDSSA